MGWHLGGSPGGLLVLSPVCGHAAGTGDSQGGMGYRGKGGSPQGWSFEQLWDLQEPGPRGSAAPPAAFPVETHPREGWRMRNLPLTQLSLFFFFFISRCPDEACVKPVKPSPSSPQPCKPQEPDPPPSLPLFQCPDTGTARVIVVGHSGAQPGQRETCCCFFFFPAFYF